MREMEIREVHEICSRGEESEASSLEASPRTGIGDAMQAGRCISFAISCKRIVVVLQGPALHGGPGSDCSRAFAPLCFDYRRGLVVGERVG